MLALVYWILNIYLLFCIAGYNITIYHLGLGKFIPQYERASRQPVR
jgi:hypothetical protein